MAFGPRSEDRSLILVDVSAPGAPIWVVDPFQDPVTGKIRGTLRLPTTDANGSALTGLTTLAVAYNLNNGFDSSASMEVILEDTNNGRVLIGIDPGDAGTDKEIEVDPLGTSGSMFFTAACSD